MAAIAFARPKNTPALHATTGINHLLKVAIKKYFTFSAGLRWVSVGCPYSSFRDHVASRDSTARRKTTETERTTAPTAACSTAARAAGPRDTRLGREATRNKPTSEVITSDSTGTSTAA